MALWYTKCNVILKDLSVKIEVGKMSGAVGTFANIPPESDTCL